MSNNDLAVQMHFSLFKDSAGYTLKPPEMRATHHAIRDVKVEDGLDEDDYWPPPRERLHRTTIDLLSLHNLPKVEGSLRAPSTSPLRHQRRFALVRLRGAP